MNSLFYRIKQSIIEHENRTLLFLFGIAVLLRTIHVVIIYGSIDTSNLGGHYCYNCTGD